MRRVRWIVSLLAATALVAAACEGATPGGVSDGSSEDGDVVLDFWVFQEGGAGSFMPALESAFETEHPDIDVNITAYPEENYGVKLDTSVAAGRTPDLVLVFGPEWMREGLLLPLDDMVAEEGIDLSTYSQAIVQPGDDFSCAWEGSLYCLGSFQGSVQLLYNKDMFDAAGIPYPAPWPPMTPDQFVDIACQLTDPEAGVWGAGVADPTAYLPFEMLISPDGRSVTGFLNSAESARQIELLAGAYERECVPSSNLLDPWEQGRDYFAQEQLAMVITDFQDLEKVENAGINYGTTAPPTPEGMEPYFFVWTDSVGVMAESDSPDEALDFIAFLTTEGQQIRFETNGDIPLDNALAEQVEWAAGISGREEGLEVLTHARPMRIFVPERYDAIAPYYDAWRFALGGEKTAQQALDDAMPAAQENLDEAWEAWEDAG